MQVFLGRYTHHRRLIILLDVLTNYESKSEGLSVASIHHPSPLSHLPQSNFRFVRTLKNYLTLQVRLRGCSINSGKYDLQELRVDQNGC